MSVGGGGTNERRERWKSILFVQSQMLENPAAAAAARVLSPSSHAAMSHQPTSGSQSDLERGAEGAVGEAQHRGADELAHSARKKKQPSSRE